MAISFDTAARGTASWNHTTSGSDRLLIAATGCKNTTDSLTASYNSVPMTQLSHTTGTNYQFYVWGLLSPALGINTVLVSPPTNVDPGGSLSYTGVLQSGLPDAISSFVADPGTAAAYTHAMSITVLANGCWAIGAGAASDSGGGGGTTIASIGSLTQRLNGFGFTIPIGLFDSNATVTAGSLIDTLSTIVPAGLITEAHGALLSIAPATPPPTSSSGGSFLLNFV